MDAKLYHWSEMSEDRPVPRLIAGPGDRWQPGGPQFSFDKQFLRDWAAGTGWDKKPPAPPIPPDVVAATRARYIDAFERITGERW